MQPPQGRLGAEQPLAVVGMAGRFPKAEDTDALWRLIVEGRDAIGPVPADRWDTGAQLDPHRRIQDVGGFLDEVDVFDAAFFGISPREAEVIDPQQRLMLETTWRALEDAGVPAGSLTGSRTGVYVGASWHDYELLRKDMGAPATQHSAVGNALDIVSARVAYFLGTTGPSMTVETGCSSSLVALHLARQALAAGDIDGAIVGGVNLILAPDVSIGLTHFGGLSPGGRCKAFSADADGFVRGEGVVAVYVKPLDRALRDGDRVRGVITATAVNQDGGGESLVTPRARGQEDLLRQIYDREGFPTAEVAYVEAHGTGTRRGDPVEAGAIGRVLGSRRGSAAGPLPVGSVKTNIGHLEAVAGLAGLVKALLVLEHRVVPPSLHAEDRNPDIPFGELNLRVVNAPVDLPSTGRLLAGVSSFGWGGTNAHVTVETPPTTVTASPVQQGGGPVFLPLSGHTAEALRTRARDVGEALDGSGTSPLVHIAGTLARRRDHFPHRVAVVAADAQEARDRLAHYAEDPGREHEGVFAGRVGQEGKTAFVFPGQGAQWHGMGRGLYDEHPAFTQAVRRCADALLPHVDWDLVDVVSGRAGQEWLSRIDMVQPVLWAMSVGLCEVWRAAGVEPDVVVGHSQGEITAATVAGMLSYEDAALLMARRSSIVRRVSGQGLMLAVDLDTDQAQKAIEGFEHGVSLAVSNGPRSSVLSGDAELIRALKELLDAEGTFCRLVNVDYASHSPQMDALEEDLLAALEPVRPVEGRIPLMSTVRRAMLSGPELDTRYWVDNLRRPVMFADAVNGVFDDGVTRVVEVSPHPILVPAIEQIAATRPEPPRALATLRRNKGSLRDVAECTARAYLAGLEPFGGFPGDVHVPLPPYPWQRTRHWVAPGRRPASGSSSRDPQLVPDLVEQGVWVATAEVSLLDQPYLGDHRVHDTALMPGAAMMGTLADIARTRTGALPAVLSDVSLRSEFPLNDGPVRTVVRWRDDTAGSGDVSLSSLPPGATSWTEHARARALPTTPPGPAPLGCPDRLDGALRVGPEEFYADCARKGLDYGPAFRAVQSLSVGEREVLADVRLPEECAASLRPDALHPALWDGAMQACLPLVEAEGAAVPSAVRHVYLVEEPTQPITRLRAYAVCRGRLLFDIHCWDADLRPLLVLEGLQLTPLPDSAGTDDGEADRLHRLAFVARPRTDEQGASPTPGAAWAVCAPRGESEAAEALAAALRDAGTAADPVIAAADGAGWESALSGRSAPVSGVVFVASRDNGSSEASGGGLWSLTTLVRACSAQAQAPRLAVVTAGAQSVLPADRPRTGPALYWGFGRVVRREHPALRSRLIDVDPDDGGWASRCARELLADDGEDQVALRGEDRYAGRIRRGPAAPFPDARPLEWRTPAQPFRLSPDRPGFWDGLTFRPALKAAPGPEEVEIEVRAAGLNFIDVMKAMGTYPDPDGRDVLGLDAVGVVTRVGESVTGLRIGDRVAACGPGALASHQTVRADHTRPVPDHLDDTDAAALPSVLATAWYGLNDLAGLAAGETVLVHSAAGGLGLAAVQVARSLGARIVATAGSEDKRRYLRGLGIDHVFDSRGPSWAAEVLAATDGCGVDVVLNSLTGSAIERGLEVLAEDGRFVEVGKQDIHGGRTIGLGTFRKRMGFFSVDLVGLMRRRPERFARLLRDVWERVETGELGPLPVHTSAFADAAEALRRMSQGLHIGKFVLTEPEGVRGVVPEPLRDGRLRQDGTYLITGGLGALGLSLAEFMAERGAGRLALVGRSAPGPETLRRIEDIRGRGTRVDTFQADVSDAGDVRRVREQLPPLRGVVHAAGLLDDATVSGLRPEQLSRVLAPKIDGAAHVDSVTDGDPLDFFILFSSAAALFGNAGQAAYAAANAAMDALAQDRRRRGLPAHSVQWGPFTDVGLAARRSDRGGRLEERGLGGFTTREAWHALERILSEDEAVVSYAPLDPRRWFESYPDTAALPSWSELRRAADGGRSAGDTGNAFLDEFRASPPGEGSRLVESKVRELAGRVLRLDADSIDGDTPFKSLGLDSLMSLELRNRLEAEFALTLSPTLLWTYGNTRALTGLLAERLQTAQSAAEKGQ